MKCLDDKALQRIAEFVDRKPETEEEEIDDALYEMSTSEGLGKEDLAEGFGSEKPLKFYGEVEIFNNAKSAIVTLYDEFGGWSGSGRIDHKSGDEESLYEDAYNRAVVSAKAKGGRLERFKRVYE